MSTLKVDTILKRTGTGTITVGQSGDTISIPAGATLNSAGTNTLTGIDNTPSFFAYSPNSYQAISSSTWTAINTTNESYDTANAFDTSTLKFIPQTSGKYFLFGNIGGDGS